MANHIYQEYKQNLLAGTAGYDLDNDTTQDGPYCALIDTGTYTWADTHEFYNPSLTGIVGTPQRITAPTVANGVLDGGDLTYTSVSGNSVEALVIYRHNAGADTTWPLYSYYDTAGGGLPVTPNGGNITVTWNASGIVLISDARAKENIRAVGSIGRATVYEFRYRGKSRRHLGFIAQEVLRWCKEAVVQPFGASGPLAVNYGRALYSAGGF